MMRAVLAVFLVLFIGISAFPQEVIKEKVDIKPKGRSSQNGLEKTFPYFDPDLCNFPATYFIYGFEQTKVAPAYYGDGELNGWIYRLEGPFQYIPWHVRVTEGAEYVTIKISYDQLHENFYDPGTDFLLDAASKYDASIYLNFNKLCPDNVARIVINFSNSERSINYSFDVYKPYYEIQYNDYQDENLGYNENRQIWVQALTQCGYWWPPFPPRFTIRWKLHKAENMQRFGTL